MVSFFIHAVYSKIDDNDSPYQSEQLMTRFDQNISKYIAFVFYSRMDLFPSYYILNENKYSRIFYS